MLCGLCSGVGVIVQRQIDMRSRRAVTIVCVGLLLVLGWAYSRPVWMSGANSDELFLPLVVSPPGPLEKIDLEPFITGIGVVTTITHAGDNRLFVAQKDGVVIIIENGVPSSTPFLDISHLVLSGGAETGLLGLAFAPDYAESGVFYVSYIDLENRSAMSRFTVSADPNVANSQPELLLAIQQPSYPGAGNIHNGGDLQFGPDGYLYWTLGDGQPSGASGPNRAQNLTEMLGKIHRIDVSVGAGDSADCYDEGNGAYTIPHDNPFADGPGGDCDEIWAYGLRNPWRISFDWITGDMFIGDVGHHTQEEIDFEPSTSPGGTNYGWPCYEGTVPREPGLCDSAETLVFPAYVFAHEDACASVTGGYVYRGAFDPTLYGHYVFADFCSGTFYAAAVDSAETPWAVVTTVYPGVNPTTFGENLAGDLFVGTASGTIYRVQSGD